ncbi:MAG: SpoIIE family protein phosphatase, partial [Isosphaeraceae bacterium]
GKSGETVKLMVGRHPECFIALNFNEITRNHMAILPGKNGYSVVDNDSTNGTVIIRQTDDGEKRIQLLPNSPYLLQNCDVIEVGKKEKIRFHDGPVEVLPAPVQIIENASPEMTLGSVSGSVSGMTNSVPQETIEGILQISRTLATKFKEEEIGPVVTDQLIRIFPRGRRYFIYATVPGTNRLRMLSWKINPNRRRSILNVNEDDIPRYSRTIYRMVIEERTPAILTESDPANHISESMLDMEIRSVMVAQVITPDGEVKGMIQVDTDKQSQFKREDLEILQVIAQQVGASMQMADLHRQAVDQARLKSDLESASEILKLFLPEALPKIPGFEFFVDYKPREDVGGDFYDFMRLDGNRLAICVCDVVGKGLPAALIMARLSSELRHVVRADCDPGKAFKQLDDILTPFLNPAFSFESRFISMMMMILDLKTLKLSMVSAGHPPILLKRAEGRIETPDSNLSGHLMGLDFGDPKFKEDNYFEVGEVQLEPGDTIVSYSDGVTDARNKNNEFFGQNNLTEVVEKTAGGPLKIGSSIKETIRKYSEGTTQFDDITLVCFGPVA